MFWKYAHWKKLMSYQIHISYFLLSKHMPLTFKYKFLACHHHRKKQKIVLLIRGCKHYSFTILLVNTHPVFLRNCFLICRLCVYGFCIFHGKYLDWSHPHLRSRFLYILWCLPSHFSCTRSSRLFGFKFWRFRRHQNQWNGEGYSLESIRLLSLPEPDKAQGNRRCSFQSRAVGWLHLFL